MCLATLIAGLGLIRNSASVVIGAMLIAPLMSPLAGVGLGLAQENILLIRKASKTVLRGFLTAYALSVLLGFLLHFGLNAFPTSPVESASGIAAILVPSEMESRGSPSFLDLIVALASGMAGAYALSRPKMVSALPGVAIAAALVPPIATSAMAFAILIGVLRWSLVAVSDEYRRDRIGGNGDVLACRNSWRDVQGANGRVATVVVADSRRLGNCADRTDDVF